MMDPLERMNLARLREQRRANIRRGLKHVALAVGMGLALGVLAVTLPLRLEWVSPSPSGSWPCCGVIDMEYICVFCGAPSARHPYDQTPPPDYCHPGDHEAEVDEAEQQPGAAAPRNTDGELK